MQSLKEKIAYVKSTISGKHTLSFFGKKYSGWGAGGARLEEETTHSWERKRCI